MSVSEKLSVSLPSDLVEFVDQYREAHDIASRSQVLARAVVALRNEELVAGYKALALEAADPLLDTALTDGLKASTEGDW